MTVFVSNTTLADNLDTWRLNTNHLATTISNNSVTVTNAAAPRGGYTVGNGHVEGTFSVSDLRATNLSGGNTSVSTELNVVSNTNIIGTVLVVDANTTFSGNVDFSTITGTNRLVLPDASRVRMTGGVTGQYIKMDGDQFTFSYIQFSDFDQLESNTLPLIMSGSDTTYAFGGYANNTPPIQFTTGSGDSAYIFLEDTATFEQTQMVMKLADSGGLSQFDIRNSANTNLHTFKTDGSVYFNQNGGAVPFVVNGENKILMVVDGNAEDILFNGPIEANAGITINGESVLVGGLVIDTLDVGGNVEFGSTNQDAHLIINGNDLNSGGNDYTFPNDVTVSGDVTGDTSFTDSVSIDGAATVGVTLGVTGNTALGANLSVAGDVDVTGSMTVDGDVTLGDGNDTIHINGSTTITSHFIPTADDQFDLGASGTEWRHLFVDGRAEIDELSIGTLAGQGVSTNFVPKTGSQYTLGTGTRAWATAYVDNATINNDLTVTNNATVGNNLTVTSDLSVEDIAAEDIAANSLITTGGIWSGANAEISGNLLVTGDASVDGDIILGTSTSTITTKGSFANAHVDDLTVTDGTVHGHLAIEGTVGGHTVTGPVELNGNTFVDARFTTSTKSLPWLGANTTVNGEITVMYDGDFKKRLIARGDLISLATFNANAAEIGNTGISGSLSVADVATFLSNTVYNANAAFGHDVSITGDLDVTGEITVGGNITVAGQIQLGDSDTDIITTEGKFANAYLIDASIENLAVKGSVTEEIHFDDNLVINSTAEMTQTGWFTNQQTKGIAQFNKVVVQDDETRVGFMSNPQYRFQVHSNSYFSANASFSGDTVFNGKMTINGELELPSNVVVTQANGVFTALLDSRGDTIIGQDSGNTVWVYAGIATDLLPNQNGLNLGSNLTDEYWNGVYANNLFFSNGISWNNQVDQSHLVIDGGGHVYVNNAIQNNDIPYGKIENVLDSFDAKAWGGESKIVHFTVNRQGAITDINESNVNAISTFTYEGDGRFQIVGKDSTTYNASLTANSVQVSVLKAMETITVGDYGSATSIPVVSVDRAGLIDGISVTTPATVNTVEYNPSLDRLRINTHDGATKDVTISRATNAQRGVAQFAENQFAVAANGMVTLDDTDQGAVLGIQSSYRETSVSRNNGTVTIGLSDDVTIQNDLRVNNDLTVDGQINVTGNTTIQGNLTVSGNTVIIDATELTVEDPFVVVASGQSTPALNAGLTVDRGFENDVHIRWNETTDRWQFTNDGTTYGDFLFTDDVPDTTYTTSFSSISGGLGANFNVTQFIDGVFDKNTAMRLKEGTGIQIDIANTTEITISSSDTITQVGDGTTQSSGDITITGTGGTSTSFDSLTNTLTVDTPLGDYFNGASFNTSNDLLTLSRGGVNVQVDLGELNNTFDEVVDVNTGNPRTSHVIYTGGYGAGTDGGGTTAENLNLYRDGTNEPVLLASSTEYVINENGLNRDIRIESDGNQNMFFIDSENNRIGIGKNNPAEALDVTGTVKATYLRGEINYTQIVDPPVTFSTLALKDHDGSALNINGNEDTWTINGDNGIITEGVAPGGFDKTMTIKVDPDGSMQVESLGVGIISPGNPGSITATGDITAFASSDRNLKENIKPIENALDKVKQINGVTYDWKDEVIEERGGEDGQFVRKHDVGVIAQEIEEVLPEIVNTRDDGTKAVKYERIVALLIEAVKDLSAEIDELKKNK